MGGVLSDKLRGELLKKPDLTLQKAHNYCRTFEAAELQKHKFSTPAGAGTEHSIGIQPVNKVNEQDKKPLVLVSFVVTNNHLLNHLAVQQLENCVLSVNKKVILPKCAQQMSKGAPKLM